MMNQNDELTEQLKAAKAETTNLKQKAKEVMAEYQGLAAAKPK